MPRPTARGRFSQTGRKRFRNGRQAGKPSQGRTARPLSILTGEPFSFHWSFSSIHLQWNCSRVLLQNE